MTLNANYEVGVVNVAAKGPDVAWGQISGPSCEVESSIVDTDNDGVIDQWDTCPNTPTGSYVNNKGCPGTNTNGSCLVLGSDLNLNIPCAQYGSLTYGFTLKYHHLNEEYNPLGIYYELDIDSLVLK